MIYRCEFERKNWSLTSTLTTENCPVSQSKFFWCRYNPFCFSWDKWVFRLERGVTNSSVRKLLWRTGFWVRLHPTLFFQGDIRDSRKYDTFRGKQVVLFINLLGKGLTQEISGDGGSIWWAPACVILESSNPIAGEPSLWFRINLNSAKLCRILIETYFSRSVKTSRLLQNIVNVRDHYRAWHLHSMKMEIYEKLKFA